MGHVKRNTDWCLLDIDTEVGRVFFQQRWTYQWISPPGQTKWTYPEKLRFHTRADKMIWGVWSNRVTLIAQGTSEFAKKFKGKRIPINLDAKWELSKPHWTVEVRKVPKGFMDHPTRVEWHQRRIFLCTEDFETDRHAGGIVPHEFGHSIGNSWVFKRGDEYKKSSPHFADKASVINVGRQLRSRHFRTMLPELDAMIPGTKFKVGGVK